MEMHFATIWEGIADAVPDGLAVVHGGVRRTWREYDDRAARLAAALAAAGLGEDSKVGLYLYNATEYLEAQFAAMKQRAVPVNVNYRYLDEELAYLLDNADAGGLVYHTSLADRVARVRDRLPGLALLVEVDDGPAPDGTTHVEGAHRYEDLVRAHAPTPRLARAADDVYMLYTGGTTGLPKGVMYANGDMARSFVQSGFPMLGLPIPDEADQIPDVVRQAHAEGNVLVSVPACPLMHGTGVWLGAFIPHLTVVTLQQRSFDADELFETVQRERAGSIVIVGDALAKPMVRALDAAEERGQPYDTSTVKVIISSGVMFTAESKAAVLDRIPQAIIVDAIGSSEGSMGLSITMKGMPAETARFTRDPTTKVFTEDGRVVQPGSGELGMVAAGGMVPLGYYKDPEKSARTFREVDGVRYSFPGDWALVNEDGSLTLVGRGSQVINTAGEKVFPEEVEESVKRAPGVLDCLVVGVPDERFGEAVTAIASLVEGATSDEEAVIAHVKGELASFKAPKRVLFVPTVPRAPNGKADYKAAKEHARSILGLG
jgi:3-oxocholest-4-en-26-oate---CoA ligase